MPIPKAATSLAFFVSFTPAIPKIVRKGITTNRVRISII
jgi:hypothetical protein